MKHLKKFNTTTEYDQFKSGSEFVLPNVSFIEDDNLVKFEPNNIIKYPVHINIAEYDTETGGWYMKGEPSLALLFEAIWPACSEHFTEYVYPSEDTAFDVSAYATWEYRNDGYIRSTAYAVRSFEATYFGEDYYEDEKGNIYDPYITPMENIIKCDTIYSQYGGGEAFKRYTTSDGKYFYSLYSD